MAQRSSVVRATSARQIAAVNPRKRLARKAEHDYSQVLRHGFQVAFLLLNAWLGSMLFLWVRQFETGTAARLVRPPGVEGWLPIAGMMNLKFWLTTGRVPALHPAAMFLLLAFLAIAYFFRKAFCSWMCPVGTLSELLWRGGKKILGRNFPLPKAVDIPLPGLKYVLLGFFVWAVSTMSAADIEAFMYSPYGMIADVKMLDFFRHIGEVGLIVLGTLVVASVLVQNFWCRYLCPYGALLGLASWLSPMRVRRQEAACIDCRKCTKACPSALPVHQLVTIKSAECTGCLECVAICPAPDALQMSFPKWGKRHPARFPGWAWAAGVAIVFFGIVACAKITGHWESHVPTAVYMELIPHADQASHPMPGR